MGRERSPTMRAIRALAMAAALTLTAAGARAQGSGPARGYYYPGAGYYNTTAGVVYVPAPGYYYNVPTGYAPRAYTPPAYAPAPSYGGYGCYASYTYPSSTGPVAHVGGGG